MCFLNNDNVVEEIRKYLNNFDENNVNWAFEKTHELGNYSKCLISQFFDELIKGPTDEEKELWMEENEVTDEYDN